MKNKPFYASGLKFSCKRCSSCCRYDSGFVFLSEKDLENLAEMLKQDKSRVLSIYCRWVTDWKGDEVLSLKEKSNKDCILWDNGCTVYEARPLQCITFPFWESVLNSKEAWNVTASGCLGINTGKLHTQEDINNFLELRTSYPILKRAGAKL